MPWWFDDERPEDEQHVRHLPAREMVRRVLPLFRPHVRQLLVGLGLLLVSVAAQLAGPIILLRLIDVHVAAGDRGGIVTSALLYAAMFLVAAAASYLQVVVLTRIGLAIVTGLKERLFGHLLRLSLAYFDKNSPGTLLARVESDAERLQMLFSEVSISVLRTLILIVGMLAVMFYVSWQSTLAVVCLAVPLILITIYFFRWMRGLYRKVRRLYARISSFVAEFVQGVPVLQVFGYERRAAQRLSRLNQDKLAADRSASLLEYGFWGFLGTTEVIAVMLILYVGSGRVVEVAMTGGTFVLFLEYTRQAFWPLAMFAEQIGFIQRAFASGDRVFGILDTPSRTPDRPDASDTVPDAWKTLSFDSVTFEYDGGTRALDDISFTVTRGERVALVGLSGGGKTTITNLLLRYYEPTRGRIALDGTDIRDFTQRAWRERLGLVMQDIHLFPGTVGENLRALADDIPDANLDRAVDVVGARSLIDALPNGYDELLAEGGTNLSMGERQLLSFARAIVRDPDLLVLDEATSSVDPGTERRLQASIDRLLAGRTSLIIAHRLSTVVEADRILVVHQGRIVEEGSHADLYAKGGIYRDLFELQFRVGEVS
jgi:ATP-binding cassette subfamily B protein